MASPVNSAVPLEDIDDIDAEIIRAQEELQRRRLQATSCGTPTNFAVEPQRTSDPSTNHPVDEDVQSAHGHKRPRSLTPESNESADYNEHDPFEETPDDNYSWIPGDETGTSSYTETDDEEAWELGSEEDRPVLPVRLLGFLPFTTTTRPASREFKRNLANHFSKYPSIYSTEQDKLKEIERHFDPLLLRGWKQEQQDGSWCALHEWLLNRLPCARGGKKDPKLVRATYEEARQREEQSMKDFLSYLGDLEVDYYPFIDDYVRSFKLWDAVVPLVRQNSRLLPYQGNYDEFASALVDAEKEKQKAQAIALA